MKKKPDPVNPRLSQRLKNNRRIAADLEAFNRCARVLQPLGKKTQQIAVKALAAIYL